MNPKINYLGIFSMLGNLKLGKNKQNIGWNDLIPSDQSC